MAIQLGLVLGIGIGIGIGLGLELGLCLACVHSLFFVTRVFFISADRSACKMGDDVTKNRIHDVTKNRIHEGSYPLIEVPPPLPLPQACHEPTGVAPQNRIRVTNGDRVRDKGYEWG